MVIFRENTEDLYAGIEYQAGTPQARKLLDFLRAEFPEDFRRIRFGEQAPEEVGIGLKPVSRPGTERLVRAAIQYALERGRKSVTLVHKGNIMKYTEGAFRQWGLRTGRTRVFQRDLHLVSVEPNGPGEGRRGRQRRTGGRPEGWKAAGQRRDRRQRTPAVSDPTR
ncbi:MAG: hypothetical protein KatS3mg115_1815 [Candidatus Poribacteria bacterium]|nr:MAG: hypothetical protein KatS3mg115_1815 [Candidatus Poribacteria bacterium]